LPGAVRRLIFDIDRQLPRVLRDRKADPGRAGPNADVAAGGDTRSAARYGSDQRASAVLNATMRPLSSWLGSQAVAGALASVFKTRAGSW